MKAEMLENVYEGLNAGNENKKIQKFSKNKKTKIQKFSKNKKTQNVSKNPNYFSKKKIFKNSKFFQKSKLFPKIYGTPGALSRARFGLEWPFWAPQRFFEGPDLVPTAPDWPVWVI